MATSIWRDQKVFEVQEMNDIYNDGTYLDNNPTWHEEDSPWKAGQIKKIIERNSLTPEKVCEVGCGAGGILSQLSSQYPDVSFHGYEISEHAFGLCCKKSEANLSFVLKDFLNEGKVDFDIVMAIDVFEHVEDYLGFLRKLRGKGEYKIFHIPLDITVITVLLPTRIAVRREAFGHIHYFTKETALRTLKDTGYEIIDYFYTGVSIDVPNPGFQEKLLNIPRKIAFAINKDFAARTLGGYSLMVLAK